MYFGLVAVHVILIATCLIYARGRDSSVGIATRYSLDGPWIESPVGGEIFRTRPARPWSLPSLLYNGYRVFSWGKAAGAWCWPPHPHLQCRGLKKGRAIHLATRTALLAYAFLLYMHMPFSSWITVVRPNPAYYLIHHKDERNLAWFHGSASV